MKGRVTGVLRGGKTLISTWFTAGGDSYDNILNPNAGAVVELLDGTFMVSGRHDCGQRQRAAALQFDSRRYVTDAKRELVSSIREIETL